MQDENTEVVNEAELVVPAGPAAATIPMRLEVGETIEIPPGGGTIQVVGREAYDWYVGWGTLTLINAALAQGKNRSGLNWWLLSLLLGPAATFLLCVMDKLPAERTVVVESTTT